jgi:hypothetical protein
VSKKRFALYGAFVLLVGATIIGLSAFDRTIADYLFVAPEPPILPRIEQNAKTLQETRGVERHLKMVVDCEATFAPYYKESIVGGMTEPMSIVLRDQKGLALDKRNHPKGWQVEAEYSPKMSLTILFAKQSDPAAMNQLKERGRARVRQTGTLVPFGLIRPCGEYLRVNEKTLLAAMLKEPTASENWQMDVSPQKFRGPFPLRLNVNVSGNGTLEIPSFCVPIRLFSTSSPLLEVKHRLESTTTMIINGKRTKLGIGCMGPVRAAARITPDRPLKYSLTIHAKVPEAELPKRIHFVLKLRTTQKEGKLENCLACPFGPYPFVNLESKVMVWSRR